MGTSASSSGPGGGVALVRLGSMIPKVLFLNLPTLVS